MRCRFDPTRKTWASGRYGRPSAELALVGLAARGPFERKAVIRRRANIPKEGIVFLRVGRDEKLAKPGSTGFIFTHYSVAFGNGHMSNRRP